MSTRPSERRVLMAQSAYLAITGAWPLIHYRSFEAITGPKRDDWLVKTLSWVILPLAFAVASAARLGRVTPEVRMVAVGTSLGLGGSSLWYGRSGRISRIYLVDAAIEGMLVVGLLFARRERRSGAGLRWGCREHGAD